MVLWSIEVVVRFFFVWLGSGLLCVIVGGFVFCGEIWLDMCCWLLGRGIFVGEKRLLWDDVKIWFIIIEILINKYWFDWNKLEIWRIEVYWNVIYCILGN